MKEKEKELLEYYKEEAEIFDDMELEAAPSGEWAEYNYPYLIQEEKVETIEYILRILGIDYEERR